MNSLHLKIAQIFIFLVCCYGAVAQSQAISGIVTSERGDPLEGVSIIKKGSGAGTQTDANGKYSIEAVRGDVLKFSYVGFVDKEVTVGTSNQIDVTLNSGSNALGEVVVVGYGTQKRSNVTSAISKLDTAVLKNAPMANVGSALQGTVSGLRVVNASGQPGDAPAILLRGGASINNPGGPLVVVDGIIRSFNDIPAEDIESMDLLKDAAATAIYGARANNGVLLITTKHGKAGSAQISYKFTGAYNQERPGYEFLGAKDYIFYNRLGNLNSGRTLSQVNSSRGYGLLSDSANRSSFDIRKNDPSLNYLLGMGWDTVGDPYGGTIIFKDHGGEVKDIVFRNTYTQDHFVNVTGGNEKGRYYASFDYFHEDGIIVGSSYKRYTGSLNGSYKVKPNIEVSSGVNLSTSSQLGVNGSEVNNMYRNLALWPTFNPWIDSAKTKPNPGVGVNDGNPLYWLSKTDRSNEVNRITYNTSVKWDITQDLYIKGTASGYLYEYLNQSFQKATQTYSNIFSNPPSYNNTSRGSTNFFRRDFQQQYNAIINYDKTIADKHDITVMLGTEYFGTKRYDMQVAGLNAPTDDIPTANVSTTFNAGSNYTEKSEYRIISAFGRLNYVFDRRFLLTAVFREDGVSSLAKENQAGFFPGMSAGWNIHNEQFFQNSSISSVISTLKPRASYGQNGNVAGLGRYEVQGGYGNQGLYDGNAGFLNTDIINAGLRWEKSKTTDIGLDLGLLKDKITVIFDYYDRRTTDLLTNLALPGYTGFGSIRTNLGTFQNKGYEFTVNANILNRPNGLRWDFGANASYVQNKILKLPFNGNDKNRQGGMQIYDPASGKVVWVGGLQEGETLGEIYAYKQLSIFASDKEVSEIAGNRYDAVARLYGPKLVFPGGAGVGLITPGDVNWLDVDKNDTIDSRDQVYIGNIYPKWTGGFSTTLSYKQFSLYARFDFALGHTIYNDYMARVLGNFQGTFNYLDRQKQSWSPDNRNTDVPKVYYADQVAAPLGKKNYTRNNNAGQVLNGNNSNLYEKGDYLASREITLSYDFSKSLLSNTKVLTGARIYVSANNLFYITKFSGPTPEPPVSPGSTSITGIYAGTYPTPKTFVLGVQVSF